MNTQIPERLALAAALLLLTAAPALSGATDAIFGGQNPLQTLVDFMLGPFAYAVMILAAVATFASLAFGSDFSAWSRRFLLITVAGAGVILADNLVSVLFGGGAGASIPPDMLLQPWPWPSGTEAGS